MDTLSREERSAVMRSVRLKDTKPEKALRSALHRAGYRFRLHARRLPGSPDIVFPSRRKVIFVHGCFWHSHHCQGPSRKPKSTLEYWIPKLEATQRRDALNRRELTTLGWQVVHINRVQVQKEHRLRVDAGARLPDVHQSVLAEIYIKGGSNYGFAGYQRRVGGTSHRFN